MEQSKSEHAHGPGLSQLERVNPSAVQQLFGRTVCADTPHCSRAPVSAGHARVSGDHPQKTLEAPTSFALRLQLQESEQILLRDLSFARRTGLRLCADCGARLSLQLLGLGSGGTGTECRQSLRCWWLMCSQDVHARDLICHEIASRLRCRMRLILARLAPLCATALRTRFCTAGSRATPRA